MALKNKSACPNVDPVDSILSTFSNVEIVSSPSVVLAARKWRKLQESTVKKRVSDLRQDKKQHDADLEREVSELVARRVALEILAKEWFTEEDLPSDERIYLLDRLIPTLVLGLEKLITQVKKRSLVDSDMPSPTFNPINFLAQFLMRNNPRYSNLSHTSPYTTTLKKLLENLKRQAFGQNENRLAKLKADVRKRREERESNEKFVTLTKMGRADALEETFLEWTDNRCSVVSFSLVQSALRSFKDYLETISMDPENVSPPELKIEECDTSGKMIAIGEYVKYVGEFISEFNDKYFSKFLRHMSNIAQEYRAASAMENVRTILANLFVACDHGGLGVLDRQRVFRLIRSFYDNNKSSAMHQSLRNPRRWPVVEIGEEEELDEEGEKDTEIFEGKFDESSDSTKHKDQPDVIISADQTQLKKQGDQKGGKTSLKEPSEDSEVKNESETETHADKELSFVVEKEQSNIEETQAEGKTRSLSPKESVEDPRDNLSQNSDQTGAKEDLKVGNTPMTEAFSEGTEEMPISQADILPQGRDNSHGAESLPDAAREVNAQEDSNITPQKEINNNMTLEQPEKEANSAIEEAVSGATTTLSNELEQEIRDIFENASRARSADSRSKSRAQSITTGSAFDPNYLNQAQFCSLILKFLGENLESETLEVFVRYLRAQYIETEEEKMERLAKSYKEALSAKRNQQVDQLFYLWDINGSGFLELSEVESIVSQWREDGESKFAKVRETFEDNLNRISRKAFHKLLHKLVNSFTGEDCFETLIQFLTSSVERSFEEKKRGNVRQKMLMSIDTAAQTSGGLLEPVYRATFQALLQDAELHGRNKVISCYIAMLERNINPLTLNRGPAFLRYVACTPEDTNYVLDKILYRDMLNVSFASIDSGKPIHVARVLNNKGVYLWNPKRRDKGIEGSFVVLPLKDYDHKVVGILGIDTMADPHGKSIFVTHEISFFQGVAKALSGAILFVNMRKKTIKIAESAASWILRRSPNAHEITIYLVEAGFTGSGGLVLRKMITVGGTKKENHMNKPPCLLRKDYLFRDYLFKCIDTSGTVTADAYGERHLAFPLRDADGRVISIIDISIGDMKELPPHENKDVLRILKLLAHAHDELTRESAGEKKNMVLEVEKEHAEERINVLFDRVMLEDLRENVGRLDARAFAELKSYNDPPKSVHNIVKAVLEIYVSSRYGNEEPKVKLEEWKSCKQLINSEFISWISTFDPTAGETLVDAEQLSEHLSNVPSGAVAKHGSIPAQYLFNWAFVCLSLVEHTSKMRGTIFNASPVTATQEEEDSRDSKMTV